MKKAGIVIAVISIAAFAALVYSGLFTSVNIIEKNMGPYKAVYEDHKGSYSKIAPVMDSVFNKLKAEGINSTTGIGIYYDNPSEVAEANLRSKGGCVIDKDVFKKFESIKTKFKTIDIPEYKCITVEFPVRTKASFIIGIIKAYPKIKIFMEEKKLKTVDAPYELYENNNKMIIIFPIGKV